MAPLPLIRKTLEPAGSLKIIILYPQFKGSESVSDLLKVRSSPDSAAGSFPNFTIVEAAFYMPFSSSYDPHKNNFEVFGKITGKSRGL